MPIHTRMRWRAPAVIAVTALLATAACQSSPSPADPADDALAYLEALAAGDAGAANALTTAQNDGLPADDSLEGATPIGGVEVGAIEEVGNHVDYVDVPVGYEVDGVRYDTTITLSRQDDGWLVSQGLEQGYVARWTGFTSQSSANWADLTSVALGTSTLGDAADEAATLYPGTYEVDADLGPYASLESTTIAVAPPSRPFYTESALELAVAPSEETLTEVTAALEENLEVELGREPGSRPALYTGFSSTELMDIWDELMAAERDGATFESSVVEPVEVTWQPEDGIWPVGHATIQVSWSGPNGSGAHELRLATEATWAEATLESLEITAGLWHIVD